MARTIRKTLCYAVNSGKKDKQLANRRFRRINKTILNTYEDDSVFSEMREVSSIWDWRDFQYAYYDSLEALKKEWWIVQPGYSKWWRYKFK